MAVAYAGRGLLPQYPVTEFPLENIDIGDVRHVGYEPGPMPRPMPNTGGLSLHDPAGVEWGRTPERLPNFRPETRALVPTGAPPGEGIKVRMGGRANPIRPGATINVPPSEYRMLPSPEPPPPPRPPSRALVPAGAPESVSGRGYYETLHGGGAGKPPPGGGFWRGRGWDAVKGVGGAGSLLGAAGGALTGAAVAEGANLANRAAAQYTDPLVGRGARALLPESWAGGMESAGRLGRMLLHLATGGGIEEAGQFFAPGGGAVPGIGAAQAAPPAGGAQTPASPAGTPIDLRERVSGGEPLPASAIPREGMTPTGAEGPPGRVMGLDKVGPGQGYLQMAGSPVNYEVNGGTVRKFRGGEQQPLGGAFSVMPDDRTGETIAKQAAHTQGMARLRQGMPYDEGEYRTLLAQQAEDEGLRALWQTANAPVSLKGSFADLKQQQQQRLLAGEFLKDAMTQRSQRGLLRDKALYDWQLATQQYGRDLEKTDRAGQWNLTSALARRPAPKPDTTGASSYGELENKFFEAAKLHGLDTAMTAYQRAAAQRGQSVNPAVLKVYQQAKAKEYGGGLGLLGTPAPE